MIFSKLILILSALQHSQKVRDGENFEIINCFEGPHDLKYFDRAIQPDSKLTAPQLIKKYGYPVEIHNIHTSDGFILEIHRICGKRYSGQESCKKKFGNKSPVLLLHAFLTSSSDWLMNTVDKALAYKLADEGFQVFLANSRGNTYSNRNTNFNANDPRFWDWSFHEMGLIDFPAIVDYIIDLTKFSQIFAIGHSMGSAQSFIGVSLKPEYNKKIKLFVSLAPAIFLSHMSSPAKYIVDFCSNKWVRKFNLCPLILGDKWMLPKVFITLSKLLGPVICSSEFVAVEICENLMFFIAGFDYSQMNTGYLPIITANTPSQTSSKTMLHFLQFASKNPNSADTGGFAQYDYGSSVNLEKYGQIEPPEYNLTKVTMPIVIYYGQGDTLVHPKDIKKLEKKLPNLLESIRVNNTCWNHIDPIYARDADKLIYNDLINKLKNAN